MNDSLNKFVSQCFLIAIIIFSLTNANNIPASSIDGENHSSPDQSEIGSMFINSHSSKNEHRFLAEEKDDDENDEQNPDDSYRNQVSWPSTLTDKRQINQVERARYSSMNTPENRPWAIPYRFGKRAAAMPYRFGKRRAAAMHFRLGKKSTAL